MVALDANTAGTADEVFDRAPIVTAFPVGIDNVVAVAASPWLTEIDIC